MATPSTLITPELPDWMETVCRRAGPDVLQLAEWFLYAGLAFGVVIAVAEAVAALRQPAAPPPAAARAAATGLQAVIGVLTTLLQALRDVKAWLALVIFGLVLLFVGASAPDLCVPEQYRPQVKQQPRVGTGGTGSGQTNTQQGGQPAGGGAPQRPAASPES